MPDRPQVSAHRLFASRFFIAVACVLFLFSPVARAILFGPFEDVADWRALRELKERLGPQARVWSLWDFRVLSGNDEKELGTYHLEGAVPHFPIAYFLYLGLASGDPAELYRTVRFIDDHNPKSGPSMENIPRLLNEYEDYRPSSDTDGAYVLMLDEMVAHFPTIYYGATWDFEKQRGEIEGFDYMRCTELAAEAVTCDGRTFDLTTGAGDGKDALRRVEIARGGQVTMSREFPETTKGPSLILVASSGGVLRHAALMDEAHYRSNFVQMYMLGRFDTAIFEQSAAQLPLYRLFKLRKM